MKLRTQSSHRQFRLTTACLLVIVLGVSGCQLTLINAQSSGPGSSPGGSPNQTSGGKIGADLIDDATDPILGTQAVNVILQLNNLADNSIDQEISQNNGTSLGGFQNLNSRAVQIPASALGQLSSNAGVSYITADREVHAAGHLTATTGAD